MIVYAFSYGQWWTESSRCCCGGDRCLQTIFEQNQTMFTDLSCVIHVKENNFLELRMYSYFDHHKIHLPYFFFHITSKFGIVIAIPARDYA